MIIGSRFIYTENSGSTNTDAAVIIQNGNAVEGTIIHTGFQSAGRGQKGNIWESEKDKNLLFSIILFPGMVQPADQFIISMVISLGIKDFLMTLIPEVKIKWPNDIFAGNDKIAGILIENSISTDSITSCVAGIGLNVNQDRFSGFIPRAVSLKMLTGRDYDIIWCLNRLATYLDVRYKQLIAAESSDITAGYISSLFRLNEWSRYSTAAGEFTGRIISVSRSGCLIVETRDGVKKEFAFREIEFIH
jgi:BirA family transcriptional regulator, biotin operon repressor / biotin---[acetyl-CoA-carboxylase] ligase